MQPTLESSILLVAPKLFLGYRLEPCGHDVPSCGWRTRRVGLTVTAPRKHKYILWQLETIVLVSAGSILVPYNVLSG